MCVCVCVPVNASRELRWSRQLFGKLVLHQMLVATILRSEKAIHDC